MDKILVVEDEKQIARFVELELKHEGYEVMVSGNGREALEWIADETFDLVLLDIMLPGLNGYEVCRRIRRTSEVPIIMVTAKDGTEDEVLGLDLGADDYITKPYSTEILLARIRRLLKKNKDNIQEDESMSVKDLTLDAKSYEVYLRDEKIDLTKREFDLLKYLLANKNQVLSREQMLSHIWGYEYQGDTNAVDVYIRYLRSKIDDVTNEKYIHTVRGVGYVIRD